ncbi:hypothetical protein A6F49_06915 [Enteractinococcus helveticum]|uniref:Flavodoxin-like fold domain-containing protein n=2 Tax=Enteractinococcus helveticum TaxID=1837282 RepID=A0A1B7M1F8_9MICC|nr:hypothetical protein A6F49_06915 [Enteractinococcus helveticum]
MPLVFPKDEPAWDDPNKTYSETVMREQKRIEEHHALVYTFPVWWYSMPAVMKGCIDRVWNHGFAYSPAKLPVQKVQWIALVGVTEEQFPNCQDGMRPAALSKFTF